MIIWNIFLKLPKDIWMLNSRSVWYIQSVSTVKSKVDVKNVVVVRYVSITEEEVNVKTVVVVKYVSTDA